jgi:hypothetical protein
MSRILNAIPNGLALGAMALAQSQALAVDQTGQAAAGSVVLSPWHLLIVIGIAGFFGGMVDGLRSDRHYKWRFGDFAKEWGTLGDALVGVTAALAIFTFCREHLRFGTIHRIDHGVLAAQARGMGRAVGLRRHQAAGSADNQGREGNGQGVLQPRLLQDACSRSQCRAA